MAWFNNADLHPHLRDEHKKYMTMPKKELVKHLDAHHPGLIKHKGIGQHHMAQMAMLAKYGDYKTLVPKEKHKEIGLGEEVVNELSRDTLKRYVARGERSADSHLERAVKHWRSYAETDIKHTRNMAVKHGAKYDKRVKYLNKADAKIAETVKEETMNEANALPLKRFRDKFAPKTREERKAAVVAAAMKSMKKEDINEISNKTLSSYMKKANRSYDRALRKGDSEEDKAMSTDGDRYPDKQKRHEKEAEKHLNTFRKRYTGIQRASVKLSIRDPKGLKKTQKAMKAQNLQHPYSESVNEVSKGKLLSYIQGASIDKSNKASNITDINRDRDAGYDANRKGMAKAQRAHGNRSHGIQLAAAKIAGANPSMKTKRPYWSKVYATEAHTEAQLKAAIDHHWDQELQHHSNSIKHIEKSIKHLKSGKWEKENFHNQKADGHDRVARRHSQAQTTARALLDKMRMRKGGNAIKSNPPMTYHAESVNEARKSIGAMMVKSRNSMYKGYASRNKDRAITRKDEHGSHGYVHNNKGEKVKVFVPNKNESVEETFDERRNERARQALIRARKERIRNKPSRPKTGPGSLAHDVDKAMNLQARDTAPTGSRPIRVKGYNESVNESEDRRPARVHKQNYSWGKMVTVHKGASFSIPIHPPAQKMIASMKPGDTTQFRDETRAHWVAKRDNDHVHFNDGKGNKVSVHHKHFNEDVSTSLRTRVADRLTKTITGKKGISTPTASGSPKNNTVKLDVTSSAYTASKRPPSGDDSGAEDLTTGAYRASRTMESTVNEVNTVATAKLKTRYYAGRARDMRSELDDRTKHSNPVRRDIMKSIHGNGKKTLHKIKRAEQAATIAAKLAGHKHTSNDYKMPRNKFMAGKGAVPLTRRDE